MYAMCVSAHGGYLTYNHAPYVCRCYLSCTICAACWSDSHGPHRVFQPRCGRCGSRQSTDGDRVHRGSRCRRVLHAGILLDWCLRACLRRRRAPFKWSRKTKEHRTFERSKLFTRGLKTNTATGRGCVSFVLPKADATRSRFSVFLPEG